MKRILFCCLMAVVLTSCATQRAYVNGSTPRGEEGAAYKASQPFFVGGIGQTKNINARQICGGRGISEITSKQTVLDCVFSVITFGIYTPRTIFVHCN